MIRKNWITDRFRQSICNIRTLYIFWGRRRMLLSMRSPLLHIDHVTESCGVISDQVIKYKRLGSFVAQDLISFCWRRLQNAQRVLATTLIIAHRSSDMSSNYAGPNWIDDLRFSCGLQIGGIKRQIASRVAVITGRLTDQAPSTKMKRTRLRLCSSFEEGNDKPFDNVVERMPTFAAVAKH
jgi:hypothetical protein